MPHIIVCMKIVVDPEMPFSVFKVDRENLKPIPPAGMPPVFSTFDENALEAALRIKDSQECKVTVLSMGNLLPKAVLQKALALGADEVIGVEGPEFFLNDDGAFDRVNGRGEFCHDGVADVLKDAPVSKRDDFLCCFISGSGHNP